MRSHVASGVFILSEKAGIPHCSGKEEDVLPVSVEYRVSLIGRISHWGEGRGE